MEFHFCLSLHIYLCKCVCVCVCLLIRAFRYEVKLYWITITYWFWTWNYNSLATWCEELAHLKRPWCWERLRAGGEGDDGGWDGWMASLTQWTWVWVDSGSWWRTGRPGILRFMGSQRDRYDWATELNWTGLYSKHWESFKQNLLPRT